MFTPKDMKARVAEEKRAANSRLFDFVDSLLIEAASKGKCSLSVTPCPGKVEPLDLYDIRNYYQLLGYAVTLDKENSVLLISAY